MMAPELWYARARSCERWMTPSYWALTLPKPLPVINIVG